MRASAERMAINAPIQGTEADIIKLAMISVREDVKAEKQEKNIRLLLQVHDELVYEIKKEFLEEWSRKIQKIMQSVIDTKKTSGVVCEAHASAGENWAETKQIL